MHHSNARLHHTLAAAALCLGAGTVAAQVEFFMYQCDADVTGTILAEAHVISANVGVFSDTDTGSLAGTYSPPFTYPFTFGDRTTVLAAVSQAFDDNGCATRAATDVGGGTRYQFEGEQYWMTFETHSSRTHTGQIVRDPLSSAAGGQVSTESLYVMPHSDNLKVVVPFVVGGGNGATMVVTDYILARADTGGTTGYTYLSWDIVEDSDGDCVVDEGEEILDSGYGSVGPNDRVQVPDESFAIPRGYYVLRIYHRPYSFLGLSSDNCGEDAADRSDVDDTCSIKFELQ